MKVSTMDSSQIDIFEIEKCLIVPIQTDLYDQFFIDLEKAILDRIHASPLLGIVVDISALKIIDSLHILNIIKLCEMTQLMDKETVIIGFQPSVASVLTDFTDIPLHKLRTFINLKKAINYLMKKKKNKSATPRKIEKFTV